MAMATAKTSRPQPKSADIGARNRPKLERMPKESSASRQPAAITTRGVRQPGSEGRGARASALGLMGRTSVGRRSGNLGVRRSFRKCNYVMILRSEEHTSELQSLMRITYAVFCLKQKKTN